MIQKYALICLAFFAFVASGFGQVNIIPVRTDVGGFATWTDTDVAGTTYVQLLTATSSTITPAMDFTAYTAETLDFTARTFGGVNVTENTITVSISDDDGANWTVLGTRIPLNSTLTAMAPFDLSSYTGTQVRIRFTVAGINDGIGAGIDNITIRGVLASTDTADYCNLQNPQNGTVEAGEPFNIQARVYEGGLTDVTAGQAPGIDAWIGYSTTNAANVGDFTSIDWTWVPATFLAETNGNNNDEYQANLGEEILTAGTYYYVSRFSLNGGPYTYGGFETGGGDGFWDGINDVSGVLTVTPAILDFYNLQFPQNGTIDLGDGFDVYAQAYEEFVTPAPGVGNGIVAWIGYSTTNATTLADFNSTSWTWVSAPYVGEAGNNDEFMLDLGTTINAAGTYYYVSRFQYNSGGYLYGGFDTGGGNGAWDGTADVSGVLVINGPIICLSEGFESNGATAPTDWTMNLITYGGQSCEGTRGMIFNATGDAAITPVINNPQTLTFQKRRSSNATAWSMDVQISTNASYTTWATVTTITTITTTCSTETIDLSAYLGDRKVRFIDNRASGNHERTIDDIEIICGPPCTPPADPTGTIAGDTPECESTVLSYSAPNANLYWQDAPDGTSTANPTIATYEVFTSGTYYVRTFDGTCWSDNTVSYTVVINQLPVINTQPNSQTAVIGENVTYTVTATNASSYQWQQSTDGILWTNVGIDNASYTITNVTLSLNGYRYRVIVSSADCGTVTSNIVTLNVFESACLDEDFVDITGWTDNGTSNWTDVLHYGNAAPCRAFGTGDSMITPAVDNPEFLQFFQDASGGGNGNTATVQYRIDGGAWQPLYSFNVTTAGNTETVNLTNIAGVNLSNETNVTFRFNSTFNTWYLDDVKVFCTTCTAPTTASTISPSSGPVGTEVTISGSDFEATTEVHFNGVLATIVSQTPTEIVVIVPNGATDGNIVVSKTSIPVICDSIIPFDVIDDNSSTCQSTFNGTDLFIYEIFDEDNDAPGFANGGMITIFNPTFESVNLSNYRIYRSSNYNTQPYQSWFSPSGTLAPGELYRIRIFGGISSSVCTTYEAPFNDTPIGFNADDGFELRKLDASSTYVSIDQALTPSYVGYYMLRDLNTTIPSPTFNATDWTITNIYDPPFNTTTCVNVGVTPTFEGGLPIINSLNNPASVCDVASITINATEGYNETSPADARQLNFEWYYNDGISNSWTLITSGGDYSITTTINDVAGTGSSTLDVSNVINKVDYQFYCRVRENDANCFTPSNAIKLNVDATIWDAGVWSDGVPNINRIAIIDDNYNTNAGGDQISFSACNLLVRAGTLTIANNTFVEVENNVSVESDIIVNERGSFKQNNNDGDVTVTASGSIVVRKETAPMNNWYEYTYWSSPVAGETIGNALADATPNRRFWFDAQNYLDSFAETGNNNAAVAGQDDIDDAAPWDWTLAAPTDPMVVGRGYASTHLSSIFNSSPGPLPRRFVYTFEGPFNNGIYNVPLYRNDAELADTNWNFIGNPYPSAIWANAFFNANEYSIGNPNQPIEGAIYLWSQNTAPADNANGNEVLNFAQADYAIINSGSGEIAGGDGELPTRFIPSGQGFFVAMDNDAISTNVSPNIETANVIFNNQMRVTGNNTQFFRTAEDTQPNKLWVNLTTDNGVFNQILISYVNGATNAYDGTGYDAPRNLSTGANSILYSIIPDSDKKFAIQGKAPNSLTLDEVIPLGFFTSINQATVYKLSVAQFEGDFFTNQTVYLKDNLLNLYHDLSAADYPFTSETGEFNERFEIVFQTNALSVGEVDLQPNDISIIELNNGHVKFTVGHNLTIQSVEIYDMLGRQLYHLPGSNAIEIYNLANLSQAAYVAKVTLSNGQSVTKRAVKRQ